MCSGGAVPKVAHAVPVGLPDVTGDSDRDATFIRPSTTLMESTATDTCQKFCHDSASVPTGAHQCSVLVMYVYASWAALLALDCYNHGPCICSKLRQSKLCSFSHNYRTWEMVTNLRRSWFRLKPPDEHGDNQGGSHCPLYLSMLVLHAGGIVGGDCLQMCTTMKT